MYGTCYFMEVDISKIWQLQKFWEIEKIKRKTKNWQTGDYYIIVVIKLIEIQIFEFKKIERNTNIWV